MNRSNRVLYEAERGSEGLSAYTKYSESGRSAPIFLEVSY